MDILAPVSVSREELSYLIDIFKALGLVIFPDLGLLSYQIREYFLELEFKFGEVEEEVHHICPFETFFNELFKFGVFTVPV